MRDANEAEQELIKCMPKVMLAEAVTECLQSGMSEEELDQVVLEMKQSYRLGQANPVLLDLDFIDRCKEWEKKENK